MPLGWYVGYYRCQNSNWIEISYDYIKDGKIIPLDKGEIYYNDNILSVLENYNKLYDYGLKYLENKKITPI